MFLLFAWRIQLHSSCFRETQTKVARLFCVVGGYADWMAFFCFSLEKWGTRSCERKQRVTTEALQAGRNTVQTLGATAGTKDDTTFDAKTKPTGHEDKKKKRGRSCIPAPKAPSLTIAPPPPHSPLRLPPSVTCTPASSGNLSATVTTYVSSSAMAVVGTTDKGLVVASCSVHIENPRCCCCFAFAADPPPPLLPASFMRIMAVLAGDFGGVVPSSPWSEVDGSGAKSWVS